MAAKSHGRTLKNRNLRIAVIGTINHDSIVMPDGRRWESLGGMLYNIRALGQLFGNRATIMPVTVVGRDLSETILAACAAQSRVDLSAVRIVDKPHNRCVMRYLNLSDRVESLSGWVGAVRREQLELVLDADLIMINFISGSDISWRNLHWLRRRFKGPLYIDFHSRTLARARDGSRYLRRPPRWRDYIRCADFLQFNRGEFQAVSGTAPDELSCKEFASRHLRPGGTLLVTLGEQGYLIAIRRSGTVEVYTAPAEFATTACETTGCGDVFASAFIYAYLRDMVALRAARFANRAAGYAAGCATLEQLDLTSLQKRG